MARIVHISSVHEAVDNRILFKECSSLAAAGHEVYLVAQHPENFVQDGVRVLALATPRNRFLRMVVTSWICAIKAYRLRPDILHYHDPELIPVGLVARFIGIPTIFDVHEDSVTSIKDKDYLGWFRFPLAELVALVESIATRFNHIVIAEHSYESRFPVSTKVLNYPVHNPVDKEAMTPAGTGGETRENNVIFVGVAGEVRGALKHANLVNLHADVQVHMVGRMVDSVRAAVIKQAGNNIDRLHIEGGASLVPFHRIKELYAQGGWSAGLAIFPYSPDHVGKELTKFFEYMAAGIPILCSDFPAWRKLIEDQGCGLCVNPDDDLSVAAGLAKLIGNPDLARSMGKTGKSLAKKYTWSSQASNLVELYDQILNDP